jgi:peroxiredoxin
VTQRPGRIAVVAAVLVLAWITWNTLHTSGPGGRGPRSGEVLPPFAAPIATSSLQGDANVRVRPVDGHPSACQVRGPDVLNSCQLASRGPVVLAFFITRSQGCLDEIDALDRLRPRFPGIGFAAVAISGARRDVSADVRRRHWRLPVGWDHDGAVADAYGISVCPTVTLARRGGRVVRTIIGEQDEAQLAKAVGALAKTGSSPAAS